LRLLRILRQARHLGDMPGSSISATPERHSALSDRIVVPRQSDGKGLEQRVQSSELRPLDVPMRDFDLTMQVETIRQARIQRIGDLATGLGRQWARALVHDLFSLKRT